MFPKPFKNLIDAFSGLPGIGPRMAERLVLYLFKQDPREAQNFARALEGLATLSRCTQCFNITDQDLCTFCRDTARDRTQICVVEEPLDLIPIERTNVFHGLYHVLGGTLAPGSADDDTVQLTITPLIERVKRDGVTEVLLATNPTTDGDATALYLKTKLLPLGVGVTRLGRGLATGADIEYADDLTLRAALTNREKLG